MADDERSASQVNSGGIDILTLVAFLAVVILGGSNAVAVRFSNFELPPFWGAAIRFAAAALIFWVAVILRRIEFPKGRALYGALIYGALTIGIPYALLYWALVSVPASLAIVLLTFGPLFTFLFAWAHGQEAFRWRSLIGALIAITGILIGLGAEIGSTVSLLPLVAIVVAVAVSAEGTVLYKSYPSGDPLVVNSLALSTGAAILILISIFARETWIFPASQATWIAYGYLVIAGSVLMFYSFLYVLDRWTASATSYSTLLIPVVTIIVAAWLLDEQITLRFLVGTLIVVIGVWMGAISQTKEGTEIDK
ncbi:MAG: DMT family transporter [Anaerolineales bacterium]|nr:DMT family transporter [Anaerolineales bacterium]